jgi:putative glutamine amidotransferase
MIRVGITQRVEVIDEYEERRDCLDQRWGPLLRSLGYLPIPLFNTIEDVGTYVGDLELDAIILTGGNDLQHVEGGTNIAPERDGFEAVLIETALTEELPVLGVCRGAQHLNIHFGGSVSKVEGHVATEHQLRVTNSPLTNIPETLSVNSYHNYGIKESDIASELQIAALTEDNSIEWATHKSHPITAIMWHPERPPDQSRINRRIIHSTLGSNDI